ncbi:hypothetical protein TWF694_010627 [Orbilia ellipsospora]|uniref:Serine hydrolase domain-containing protein n=1 Tax=Orbilia ellipsospora TaxID=2528407 RepID=A0AAV9XAI8_9PEZI
MRFLCLHGLGTNSKVFETQTAAIRAELGDEHTYEFVDGTVSWTKAPELGDLFSDDDQYLAYYDPYNSESMLRALHQLEAYIQQEGPFDGVMGFSHGCALSSTLLLGRASEKGQWQNPFKCAIFLAAGGPVSWSALHDGEVIWLDRSYTKSQISIPTAHVWALNDKWGPSMSAVLEQLCIPQVRHGHVHNEGHTVPGRRSPETLRAAMKAIRRTIQEVESGC